MNNTLLAEPESPAAPESDAAAAATDALASLDPVPVTGIFDGLARIIDARADALLLSIVKMPSGELRIAVQPSKAEKESNESALPLIVMGTTEELDRMFFDELSVYVAARTYAVASAATVAQQIKTAADNARTNATTPRKTTRGTPAIVSERAGSAPAAPAPPPPPALKKNHGELTIVTVPADATLRVEDSKGKAIAAKPGDAQQYPAGRLTITVSHDGYALKFVQHTVVADKRETITVELAAKPGLFPQPEVAAPTVPVEPAASPPEAAPTVADAGAGANVIPFPTTASASTENDIEETDGNANASDDNYDEDDASDTGNDHGDEDGDDGVEID